MPQYINKSALVAEIERRREYYENIQMIKSVYESNIEDFNELLSFLDTLEVKEVELGLEDIKTIDKLLNQCVDYSNPYQEVLKRFKAQKGEEV